MEKGTAASILFTLLCVFAFLFLYTKIAGPIPFSVNNTTTTNSVPFQTQGTGKAAAAPDTAIIQVGVTQTGTNALEAQKKTNQIAGDVINAIKSQGVAEKDIKTVSYTVDPIYSTSGQQITGYTVAQNMEVKSPIDKANGVVDAVTKNGANLVGGVTYTLNDKKEEELTNLARKQAVDMAKKSAQGLAKAADIKLGKIINVTEDLGGSPRPVFLDATKAANASDTPTTNITPGQTNIEITITLTYQTL